MGIRCKKSSYRIYEKIVGLMEGKMKKNYIQLLTLVIALVVGCFLISPIENQMKSWEFEVAGLSSDYPLFDYAYEVKEDCSFFTSKQECLDISKAKINRSTKLNETEKQEAILTVEKLTR